MSDENPQAPNQGPNVEVVVPPQQQQQQGEMAEFVQHPAKLLRIASMVRELLEEVRQSPVDEGGRKRLMEVYARSVGELRETLSEELVKELDALSIPFEGVPSESEIRVAQAQLVGWLEGLFHGIQAALWSQQMAARAQLEEMRRRGLPGGGPSQDPRQTTPPTTPPGPAGQYL
ncbi:MAG TPA: proteasome activator [Actinomycetota bacterium]|nr:proteasome activator [Actinomycetota bacterium]